MIYLPWSLQLLYKRTTLTTETMVGSSAYLHPVHAKVNYLRKCNLVPRELYKFQPSFKSHCPLSSYRTLVKLLNFTYLKKIKK